MYTVSFQLRFMSWLISSQEEGKIFLHQMVGDWKEETQEFCGAPVRFGLRTPKCIDFATCFGLWLVLLSSINWMRTCTTLRSIHRKVKVKNYRLQLVPLLPSASTSPTSTIGAWWNSDLLFIIKFSLSRCYSHCFIYLPLEATMETSDHFHWEFLLLTIVSQSTKLLSKFVKQWEIFLSFLLCKLVPTIFGRNLTMGSSKC